jgi:type II secretory pathway component PulF
MNCAPRWAARGEAFVPLTFVQAWNQLDTARFKSELYRMWYAGYHAGLEHPRSLETMDDFHRSPTVAKARTWLLQGTKRRQTLAAVTRAKPELFTPFEAALLVLGEESGQLEQCLHLLAEYFAAENRLVLWVKKKMTYPMFNVLAATFIAPFSLLFFGHTAAYLSIVISGLTVELLAGGSLLLAAARWFQQRPKYVRGRLLRSLTIAVESGLPLGRAIELAVNATANTAIRAHVARFTREQLGGQPLSRTFAECPVVPREMTAAMEVAEASGDYAGTLKKMAEFYEM